MSIELPGPVADFLNFIGIPWPNVDEDKVREFGQHVTQFGADLSSTHAAAGSTLDQLGSSYQGAAYEQLLATWGRMSSSHMSELTTGCQVVGTAMDVGADVITGMKIAAIAELVVLAAEFVADQAAAFVTFGASEAALPLLEEAGEQVVNFLEQEAIQQVEGQIINAAVQPLVDKVAQALSGMVYQGVADALGVSPGGSAGGSVQITPDEVLAHAQTMEQHAQTVAGHAQTFTANTSGISFE